MKAIRLNGLGLFFGALFMLALVGQSVAGHQGFNDQERQRAALSGDTPSLLSYPDYVTSPEFARDVMENWQSEYLQFLLFILVTVWLVQRGSPESKRPDETGTESTAEQRLDDHAGPDSPALARAGGVPTLLYSNSLLIVMGAIFLAAWFAQSITGLPAYNSEQSEAGLRTLSWVEYVGSADFWERTLQNWQSEFLAVGSMAVFAIYLRQRGSPESKPVGASHDSTGIEG